MIPNFLFIGPDKTGSSWMYAILKQHPQCYVPQCKDIYFFDRYYNRGLEWYFSFFKESDSSHLAIGELSHDYLFSEEVAKRIKADLPNVKLMTCLRHPVERTFSHYLFMIRSGRTQEPFEVALKNYPELINNSLYYKHLSQYLKYFSKEQLKILLFQDLKSDPKHFAKQIFDYLDVPFIETLNYEQEVLGASRPRVFMLAQLAKSGANLARDLGLATLVGQVKQSNITKILYTPFKAGEKPRMAANTATELLNIFREDTLQIQALLETDLSSWLTYRQ